MVSRTVAVPAQTEHGADDIRPRAERGYAPLCSWADGATAILRGTSFIIM